MRVAFQGDRGAYAESAIAQIWQHRVEQIPVPTFTGAVRAVQEGDADACVIPIENSIVGRVDAGWHALAAYPNMRTVGEALVPVRHCLLAPKGATLEGLTSAISHPVALAQCSRFFETHSWSEDNGGRPGGNAWTSSTETTRRTTPTTSIGVKTRFIGVWTSLNQPLATMAQLSRTRNGVAKRAICKLDW